MTYLIANFLVYNKFHEKYDLHAYLIAFLGKLTKQTSI